MLPAPLRPEQDLAQAPLGEGESLFLAGPAGAGKSTVLAARLAHLIAQGVPAYSILVLLPDRPARERLRRALREVPLGPYGGLSLHTYYSLAHKMVALFWPLVARQAGFAHPERPPIFLTYELAQYHMAQVIRPLLEQGYFEGLHLHPQRLFSQLLDNLNKAALNGYPLSEVLLRLSSAWRGPQERQVAFRQAQECIERFRQDCLERGLLDLSLTLEVLHLLLETPPFWGYFSERYRHLLVDNLEENVPAAHAFIAQLLPHCDSALLIHDEGSGYRLLLGADPEGVAFLRQRCSRRERLAGEPRPADPLAALVARRLGQEAGPADGADRAILGLVEQRYRSDMIRKVAAMLARMVHEEGVPPDELAILAPYLDGVLRFSLTQECARLGVPLRVLRRYRRPIEEPAVRALLTLAALLHPDWDLAIPRYDVAEALGQALGPLDPIRAAMLADAAFDPVVFALCPPDELKERTQGRLEPLLYERYRLFWERWEAAQALAGLPWENLLGGLLRLLLPEAGRDPTIATACAELLESARRFRTVWPALRGEEGGRVGQEYVGMLRRGLVTARYIVAEEERTSAVLLSPVHSYLLAGRPVRRQFWLDIGSGNWWDPPQQPLTNPYVLSARRPPGEPWSDAEDYAVRQEILARVVLGLARRCTEGVVLCRSELGPAGQPQDGPLLRALEPLLWDLADREQADTAEGEA